MIALRLRAVIAAALALAATLALGLGAAPAFADTPSKPADKPAAKADTVSDADAQRFFGFFDKFVSIVVANQSDCAKMATGITAHIDANQALLKDVAAAKEQNKQLPPAIKEKIEKKIRDELQPALQKCVQDKAVQGAMQKMEQRPAAPPAKK